MNQSNYNWAGNIQYNARQIHSPATIEEVQDIVRRSEKVKVLGTRHSFNRIADTSGDMISLEHLKQITIDESQNTVMVAGGTTYGDLCQPLDQAGYALRNLASLPHISIAGACATGTHGSGVGNGCLSTEVSAIDIVNANGDIVHLNRRDHPDQFTGAVVGVGALGVVVRVQLDLQPRYQVQQVVYRNLPLQNLLNNLDQILGSAYSVSLFTDWRGDTINQIWQKHQVDPDSPPLEFPAEFYGATLADDHLHPIEDLSAEHCTRQLGLPGPWYERLPHFRLNFTPSSGDELQSEYIVPREHANTALQAIQDIRESINPHLHISEIRTIAADDLWLSPCYQQDSLAIHFTWKPDWDSVKQVLPLIEEKLAPYSPRPHWGKLFTLAPPDLHLRYAQLAEFRELAARFDPVGKFHNPFLQQYLFG